MKQILHQLYLQKQKVGLLLMIVRLPSRLIRNIFISLNTWYWRLFLGKAGKNVRIGLGTVIDVPRNVYLEDNVTIGSKVLIGAEILSGKLFLEADVQINDHCHIDHSGNVTIGKNTLISSHSTILSHSHGYDPRSTPKAIDKRIGEDVWIGYRSIITENVLEIENSVIIAAGSVVVKSCDRRYGVYGGVPAKFIKGRSDAI